MADVQALSDEELIRHLPDAVLLRHPAVQQAGGAESPAQASGSFYDSPRAKSLFRTGGQVIGGLAGAALATPATLGMGTVGGGVVGGVSGAMLGEGLRQTLATRQGQTPPSYQAFGQSGTDALMAESVGPILGALAKPVGGLAKGVGRALYRNIPDPVLSWVKSRAEQGMDILSVPLENVRADVEGSVKKLGQAVQMIRQDPTRFEPPSPKTLYPVAEKAAQALDAVRERVGQQYGEAASHALETPARASLAKSGKFITSELRNMGILDARNRPVAFGTREFTTEERMLLNVFEDVRGVSPHPTEGLPESVSPGTFINYDKARRLLARLDEASAGAKTRNTQRILGTVRRFVVDGLKQSDAQLAKRIPEYGQFVGLRDTLETVMENPDKIVQLLMQSGKATKASLRGQLEALDALAPTEMKFLPDLQQYEKLVQATELAKRAPKTISSVVNQLRTPQQMEKVIRHIFDQPVTTLSELEALETVSGTKFLDEFKDLAARMAFQSYRPAGLGLPGNLALGALGFGGGGPIGAGVGVAAGTAMSMPRVQAEVLRRVLPAAMFTKQAGQVAAGARLPQTIAALLTPREGR